MMPLPVPQPVPKHFRLRTGVTFSYAFEFATQTGPFDLTGCSATWTITWTGGTTTLLSGVSAGQSGIFFGGQSHTPANGMVNLVINATDTATLPWTVATYTLRLTDSLNTVYQLLEGGMGTQ